MKVIAVGPQGGQFHDRRQRQGDVFLIPDTPRRKPSPKEALLPACKEVMDKNGEVPEAFSSLWMRKAAKGTPERSSTAPRPNVPTGASLGVGKLVKDPNDPNAAGFGDDSDPGDGGNDSVI